MFLKIKKLFFTGTGKDTSILFIGTLINALFGGLFFAFVPKLLGPEAYGLFAVVTATGMMIANFANLGVDTGILRFLKKTDPETNEKIIKLGFYSYLVIGLVVFIIGLIISKDLAQFLGQPQLENLIKIAFSGIIFILLANFFVAVLQSRHKFLEASLVVISANAARLLVLMAAVYFWQVDLKFLTALFFFVTATSVIVGKLFVSLDFLKAKNYRIHLKDFFGYNFWVAAAVAISAIPFDNYLLLKIAGATATGIYAAPAKLITIIQQFGSNLSRVLAPRLSSYENNQQVIDLIKETIPIVVLLSIVIILLSALAQPFVNFLGKNQFQESVNVFRIITVGLAFNFATAIPVSIIYYYFGNSKACFAITVLATAIWTGLNAFLIPQMQALGAAIAFTMYEMIALLMFSAYIIWKFAREQNGTT